MLGPGRWLRKLIRRKMMPIPEDTAVQWKTRLSWAYVFVAWNAFGLVAYSVYNGKLDWANYYGLKTEEEKNMKNNEYYARAIGRPGSTKLITLRGFTSVESKDFDFEKEVLAKQLDKPEEELTTAQKIQRRQIELDRLAKEKRAAEQAE